MQTNSTTVSFGEPVTAPVLIPVLHSSTPSCIAEPFMVNGEPYKVTCLSLGTPQGVVFVDDAAGVDVPALGQSLGTHRLFPKGASIVFAQITGKDSLKARLWQRGKGEAAFSAESACVAATAAIMLQKLAGSEAEVSMDGGTVNVKWDRGSNCVSAAGAAELLQA